MSTVKEMLDVKGRELWSIESSQSIHEAVGLMEARGVGALTILEDDRMVGIISEGDCARQVILQNKPADSTSVADIMATNVVFVSENTSADKCMSLMNQKKIRHLPVMEGEELVGIITVGDLMKFIVKKQSMTIEELESYIMDETGGSG